MSVGLLAVVDDILSAALKASAKTAGVVIDDAAVTPQYVQGITPARELPVVWKIALGSIINKYVIIIPIALLLTAFAPGVLPFLLILGGGFLCFEGAEKVLEWFGVGHGHGEDDGPAMNGSWSSAPCAPTSSSAPRSCSSRCRASIPASASG